MKWWDKMNNTYEIKIGRLTRHLPIIRLSPNRSIASFVTLGDAELVNVCAKMLKDKIPEVNFLVTAEAKGIPLAHELCKELGMKRYVVARKSVKAYMNEPISCTVISITSIKPQSLFLNDMDAELINGKKIALIDDVVSTGQSMKALEELVTQAGAIVMGRICILAEGEAKDRKDIIYLEKLPLFD